MVTEATADNTFYFSSVFPAAQLGQEVAVLDYVEPSVKGKITRSLHQTHSAVSFSIFYNINRSQKERKLDFGPLYLPFNNTNQ